MQQSNEIPAEPSMEDILASIRKIISEEPAGAKSSNAVRAQSGSPQHALQQHAVAPPTAAPTPHAQRNAPVTPSPVTPSSVPSTPSRLSDIVRELAPAAVPVSSVSTASFHDDMLDLVEGAPSDSSTKSNVEPIAPVRSTPPASAGFRPVSPMNIDQPAAHAEPAVAAPKRPSPAIPAPILAPQQASKVAPPASKASPDFGSFIPSSAESIGMTSPRPTPISMGAEFRNIEPVRAPAPARDFKPEPAPATPIESLSEDMAIESGIQQSAEDSVAPEDGGHDPVAAAQTALGALAMGFATPAKSPSTMPALASAHADVAVQRSEMPSSLETGRKSLDDSIVDMLRPMLRDWLDAHLPEMVEKALAQEIRDQSGRRD